MPYANNAINVVCKQINGLGELARAIKANEELYTKIVDMLTPFVLDQNYSKRIIITGVGKNANLATKASETFASLGIPSMYLNSCHYTHGDAGFIGPNDIVIHISRSGTTPELIQAARHLRSIRPSVVQILFHCNPTKEVESAFDIEFFAGEAIEADANKLAPTTSTTILLVLLDTIGIQLSKQIKFTRADFLRYHPGGALGNMLQNEMK